MRIDDQPPKPGWTTGRRRPRHRLMHGLVVLVSQEGIGNELLRQQAENVAAWVPRFLFA